MLSREEYRRLAVVWVFAAIVCVDLTLPGFARGDDHATTDGTPSGGDAPIAATGSASDTGSATDTGAGTSTAVVQNGPDTRTRLNLQNDVLRTLREIKQNVDTVDPQLFRTALVAPLKEVASSSTGDSAQRTTQTIFDRFKQNLVRELPPDAANREQVLSLVDAAKAKVSSNFNQLTSSSDPRAAQKVVAQLGARADATGAPLNAPLAGDAPPSEARAVSPSVTPRRDDTRSASRETPDKPDKKGEGSESTAKIPDRDTPDHPASAPQPAMMSPGFPGFAGGGESNPSAMGNSGGDSSRKSPLSALAALANAGGNQNPRTNSDPAFSTSGDTSSSSPLGGSTGSASGGSSSSRSSDPLSDDGFKNPFSKKDSTDSGNPITGANDGGAGDGSDAGGGFSRKGGRDSGPGKLLQSLKEGAGGGGSFAGGGGAGGAGGGMGARAAGGGGGGGGSGVGDPTVPNGMAGGGGGGRSPGKIRAGSTSVSAGGGGPSGAEGDAGNGGAPAAANGLGGPSTPIREREIAGNGNGEPGLIGAMKAMRATTGELVHGRRLRDTAATREAGV